MRDGRLEVSKVVIISLLTNLMILISGCVDASRYNPKEKPSSLIENQSTKAEVKKLLGNPVWKINEKNNKGKYKKYPGNLGKNEIWSYYYFHRTPDHKREYEIRNLFIDDTGILKKICVSNKIQTVRKEKIRKGMVPFAIDVAFTGLVPALIKGTVYFYGDYTEPNQIALLKKKQTTKTEVIEFIGKPDIIYPGEEGKGEFWIYYYFVCGDFGYQRLQEITLYIDDAGILQKITVVENSGKSLPEDVNQVSQQNKTGDKK